MVLLHERVHWFTKNTCVFIKFNWYFFKWLVFFNVFLYFFIIGKHFGATLVTLSPKVAPKCHSKISEKHKNVQESIEKTWKVLSTCSLWTGISFESHGSTQQQMDTSQCCFHIILLLSVICFFSWCVLVDIIFLHHHCSNHTYTQLVS